MFIDTHTNLYSEAFENDRDEMITRALKQGVERFILPSIDASYTKSMYGLEAAHPDKMFLMMGLHPTSVKENYKEVLALVQDALEKRSFVAIGEIGIDLYWDKPVWFKRRIYVEQ